MSKPITSITLVKGPTATGRTFEFRVADKEKKNSKVVIGDEPVTVALDTPLAKKINLAANIQRLVTRGYLSEYNEAKDRAKSDGANTPPADDN